MEDSDSNNDSNEEVETKVFRILKHGSADSPAKRIKCTFRLIPSGIERDKLNDVIFKNGADVLEEAGEQSDHAVNLLNDKYFFDHPEKDCVLPWDTFSSLYVYDAVRSKEQKLNVPSLDQYRLTDTQFEPHDVNKILFQKAKWSDLVPLDGRQQTNSGVKAQQIVSGWKEALEPKPTTPNIVPSPRTSAVVRPLSLVLRAVAGPSKTTATSKQIKQTKTANSANADLSKGSRMGNDSDLSNCDDVSYADEGSDTESRSSTETIKKAKGVPFSRKEGQKMLDLICENNAFMYTKGMKLWHQVEKSGKFPGRTKQSLSEHFRKKVLPNALKAERYRISPEHLKQLKKAQERAERTKHANVCPDYTF